MFYCDFSKLGGTGVLCVGDVFSYGEKLFVVVDVDMVNSYFVIEEC